MGTREYSESLQEILQSREDTEEYLRASLNDAPDVACLAVLDIAMIYGITECRRMLLEITTKQPFEGGE